MKKLAQWYRSKYKRPEAAKSAPTAINPFATALGIDITTAPRRLSPFHYYIKIHYASRVKEEHERRYMVAMKRYEDAMEEERDDMDEPVRVAMMTSISVEFWKLESDDFRDEVAKDAEAAHLKEVEEWEARKNAPKTPQQFHQ